MTLRIKLILAILLCSQVSFSQKKMPFLVSYSDSSSGEELIGYKTVDSQIIIKAKYSFSYTDTMYSMAIVLKKHEWIGIDRNEKIILKPFIFDNGPDYVEEGLFRFVENGKIGFANLNGKKIIPAVFDFATPFSDGISKYTLGGKKQFDKSGEHWYWAGGYEIGFMNKFGYRFKKVSDLKNDKREAWTTDNRHFLLNKNGQVIKTFKS